MKNFFIILIKFIFGLLLSLLILYFDFIVFSISGKTNVVDWQIVIYVAFSFFTAFLIWVIVFTKINYKCNFLIFFLIVIWLFLPRFLPNVMKAFDIDSCLDSGLCREGITNMQDNKGNSISINKENCINNGYKWYEEDKSCDLRKNNK